MLVLPAGLLFSAGAEEEEALPEDDIQPDEGEEDVGYMSSEDQGPSPELEDPGGGGEGENVGEDAEAPETPTKKKGKKGKKGKKEKKTRKGRKSPPTGECAPVLIKYIILKWNLILLTFNFLFFLWLAVEMVPAIEEIPEPQFIYVTVSSSKLFF